MSLILLLMSNIVLLSPESGVIALSYAQTQNEFETQQNVSGSRIRQIWCHYKITRRVPILAKPGRPPRSITNEDISAVIGTYKEYPCSAVMLEIILQNRHGIKIPHNRIHKILTLNPEACTSLGLEHRLQSSYEKSPIERVLHSLKNRTEAFDDYYRCMICDLKHVYRWTALFVSMYNAVRAHIKFTLLTHLIGGVIFPTYIHEKIV
ncbi:MAG: hypothetical protein WAK17_24845 [Candidatus Nitrosopolaris sp.]